MFLELLAISEGFFAAQPYLLCNSATLSLLLSAIAMELASSPAFFKAANSASPIMPAPMIPTTEENLSLTKQGYQTQTARKVKFIYKAVLVMPFLGLEIANSRRIQLALWVHMPILQSKSRTQESS